MPIHASTNTRVPIFIPNNCGTLLEVAPKPWRPAANRSSPPPGCWWLWLPGGRQKSSLLRGSWAETKARSTPWCAHWPASVIPEKTQELLRVVKWCEMHTLSAFLPCWLTARMCVRVTSCTWLVSMIISDHPGCERNQVLPQSLVRVIVILSPKSANQPDSNKIE